MKASAFVVCLGLFACGGGAQEANAPDGADELYEDDAAEQNMAGTDGADSQEGLPATSDEDQPGGPATPEDLQQILQLVINDEALEPYLKLEEPGRFPLQISGDAVPGGAELMKNTQPVKIVPAPSSKDAPVLVFTSIDATANEARVKYRYDVEGVRGSATVKKLEGRWQLTNSRVTEY
jgi:hypothetical protein